jgi:hypothetical protein
MPWLYLLLAAAALAVAFKTASMAVLVLCLLVALVLAVAWLMTALAQRIETRSGDMAMIIDPAELRRLREQAEARKAALAGATAGDPVQAPTGADGMR